MILSRVVTLGLLFTCQACTAGGVRFEEPGLQSGAVVSEHPLATAVGLAVLERGGNAADAAVATAFALAVVYPQAGNLGGGGFAIWAGAGGDEAALDFRERAPRSTSAELYLDARGDFVPQRSIAGPLAVGVPGSTLGLHELWRRHGSGTQAWAELLRPAIRLAREGYTTGPWLTHDLERPGVRERMNPAALALYYPGGEALDEGTWLVQAELATTLARIAAEGPRGFYEGPVAEALVAELRRTHVPGAGAPTQGIIEREDLRGYEAKWRAPLIGHFQGDELISMPPPSSGGLVILQVLAVLEGLPLGSTVGTARAAGLRDGLSERMLHWWIESLRMAFADRAEHMGDPDFHAVPVEQLLSREWITERRVSISDHARPEVSAWSPAAPVESSETTHLSVLDSEGNAVSMTTTLNGLFGSGILVREAGFFLNNELDDFSIQAGVPNQFGLVGNEANSLQPGKRPLSSMSPTILRDSRGRVSMVLGSPGGPRIITSVLQVILRVLVLEQQLGDAVRSPRLHQQWSPQATLFEGGVDGGWDVALLQALEQRGHPLEVVARSFGSVQAIWVGAQGEVFASSDPRHGGAAGVTRRGVTAPALPPEQ